MKNIMRRQEGYVPWLKLLGDLLVAYILTLIILALLALLLYKINISKELIGVGIIMTYMVSCFVAGNLAGKRMKQKRFVWGIWMGLAYFIILLVLTIIVNQSFTAITDSLLTTLILCIGGGMLGGMLS